MGPQLTSGFAVFAALLAVLGLTQVGLGRLRLQRFLKCSSQPLLVYPAVTILKPLHGDEPMLEEALASFCSQRYVPLQIIFGLQDPADPAISTIERLIARFPAVEIKLVVSEVSHGANRKISNLINMLPLARHDVLVVADSDMHVAPDYIRRVVETLSLTSVGLVTSLYVGKAAFPGVAGQLGAAHINHSFTPGALIGRLLGRRDCLGATMALRRQILEMVGGFEALVDHLADDAVLGRLINGIGLDVALAPTMPATTVAEKTGSDLFAHELRWARTIRCVAPIGFALSIIQYPFFWLTVAFLSSGGAAWSIGLTVMVCLLRQAIARQSDSILGARYRTPFWLLPVRDILSVLVMTASYTSTNVAWRGHTMTSKMRPLLRPAVTKFVPGEG